MGEGATLCGGEESGGYGVTAHLRNKDGVLLALLTAAAERERPLDDRIDALVAEHGEIYQDRTSVDCPDERKPAVIDALDDALPDAVAGTPVESVNTVDGFKIALTDGTWLLVRPSGTEPKMRVYAEAGSEDRVAALLAAGRDLVEPLV
jgi:phosphomannomutase